MKKSLLVLITLVAAASFSLTGYAWDRGACKEDVEKFCKDVKMENDGIKNCLKKNAEKLSQGCKANLFDAAVKKKESEK